MDSNGNWKHVHIQNACYVPAISFNLLSVRQLWKSARLATHFGEQCYFKDKHIGTKYFFPGDKQHYSISVSACAVRTAVSDDVIHGRFGHAHHDRIRLTAKHTEGMPSLGKYTPPHDCQGCNEGGAQKRTFKRGKGNPFTKFGQRVDSDLCGPFPKSINGGYIYALNFVDCATRWQSTYYLKNKSAEEVLEALIQFQKDNRKDLEWNKGVVERWHSDNGGEFTSTSIKEYAQGIGVIKTFSAPWTPEMNPYAERMWRTLLKPMRILFAHSKLHHHFWVYCMDHAVYLHNRMPSKALPNHITPFEARYNRKPNVSKLRVWGCKCYYLLPKRDVQGKLGPRAVPALHLGRGFHDQGYMVYVPSLNRLTTAEHLKFIETKSLDLTHKFASGEAPKPHFVEPRDRPARSPRGSTADDDDDDDVGDDLLDA